MNKIRCIAIDDEPPALRQIEEYILHVTYLELRATFQNALDASNYLKENSIDLIFLDIHMEHLTGMEFLKLLKNKPKVILTTAYDTYALQAFDLDVNDYLLKPISFERFFKAVEKVYNELRKSVLFEELKDDDRSSLSGHIFVKTRNKTERVDLDEILYVEGLKEYLIIQTVTGRLITLMSFKQLLDRLPAQHFSRVHKSYIVAIGKIDSVFKNSILIGEKSIPIGPTYKLGFQKQIEG